MVVTPVSSTKHQHRSKLMPLPTSPRWMQTSMNKLPMTAAGHLVLEEDLRHRIQVERPRLIQRIQEAIADDSNLAENSEYQAAKTEQEINENRIA
jgi:hypothetical protein